MDALASVTSAMRDALGGRPISEHADFFERGGDSMAALEVVVTLRRELGLLVPIDAVQRHPTPALLAGSLDQLAEAGTDGLAAERPRPAGAIVPLSAVQHSIYQAMRLWEPAGVYNLPAVYRLPEGVDRQRLARSLMRAASYHEAARARLARVDGALGLVAGADAGPELVDDSSAVTADGARAQVTEFLRQYVDPYRQSLRLLLLGRTGSGPGPAGPAYLAVSACHLVFDGETLSGYLQTAAALYDDRPDGIPERYLASPEPALGSAPAPDEGDLMAPATAWTRFRFQRPRADILDASGRRLTRALDPEQAAALNALASKHSATRYEVLSALIWVLAARDTAAGADDAVTLCGASRQPDPHTGQAVTEGQRASLKPLSFGPLGGRSVGEAIRRAARVVRDSQSDQVASVTDEAPPFVLSLQDGRAEDLTLGGAPAAMLDWGNGTARFELTLLCHLRSRQPRIVAEYMTQCCDEQDVAGFLDALAGLIVSSSADERLQEARQ